MGFPRTIGRTGPSAERRALSARETARLLLATACLLFSGPSAATEPGPLMWRAHSPTGKGTFYLLGSVHLGNDRTLAVGPAVLKAWEGSEELVVEIDPSGMSDQALALSILQHGTLKPPVTLRTVLSPETYALMLEYFDKEQVNPLAMEHYKPWVVASMVVVGELKESGYTGEKGVDNAFLSEARGVKPIVALESPESQYEIWDDLSPALQDMMLKDALVRMGKLDAATDQLFATWQRGDEKALEAIFYGPMQQYPELADFYEVVFFRRNEVMASQLAQMPQNGSTRFVVLGAGHLIGERGVPSLLAARGYRVERVTGR